MYGVELFVTILCVLGEHNTVQCTVLSHAEISGPKKALAQLANL